MSILWTDVKTFFINQNEVTKIQLNGTTLWQKSSGPTPPTPGPDYTEPFYIENPNNSNITVTIKKYNNNYSPTLTIEYSTDKTTWTTLGNTSTSGLDIAIDGNSKMYFRCDTNYWSYNSYYNYFTATSTFNIGGNIMSLLYGSSFTGEETSLPSGGYSLRCLFQNSVNLIDASRLMLPATTLAQYCYSYMFYGCTSLTTAPETLPATTLTDSCYRGMFQNCSNLTQEPALPATTLQPYCYYRMFYGCSSLNYVKCLATDISASNCTSDWVNGVANSGTFVKDANMSSWTTGVNGIPTGWTVQDA